MRVCEVLYLCGLSTWTDVWCRASRSARFFLGSETLSTSSALDFQSDRRNKTKQKKHTWKKLRRYIRAWMMSSENVQFFLPVNVRRCSGWRDRAPSLRSPQSTSSKTPGPGGPWSCPRAGQGGCRCAVSGTVHVSDKRNKTKKNENVEL